MAIWLLTAKWIMRDFLVKTLFIHYGVLWNNLTLGETEINRWISLLVGNWNAEGGTFTNCLCTAPLLKFSLHSASSWGNRVLSLPASLLHALAMIYATKHSSQLAQLACFIWLQFISYNKCRYKSRSIIKLKPLLYCMQEIMQCHIQEEYM